SQARFEALAVHCELNFRPPALLLGAEIARIEARDRDAYELYAAAVEFAAGGSLVMPSALANELCGRWLVSADRPALGRMHLAQARAGCSRGGGSARVGAMQRQSGGVLLPRSVTAVAALGDAAAGPASEPPQPAADRSNGFDLVSVTKAAQAIAAE